ncbi:MAG: hypothetical protein FJW39_05110 [Acidobacteria bacterium]|nr:hypothetical protein [Acidobacteriota bacterium]
MEKRDPRDFSPRIGARIAGYVPGTPAEILPPGLGRLIPAGSDLWIELHHITNGKPAESRFRLGMVFARQKPSRKVLTLGAFPRTRMEIPPMTPAHPVNGSVTLHADSELAALYPHMHLRGKAMEISAEYPDGRRELLVNVPRYDFNWQIKYEPTVPRTLPRGTTIHARGVFDNSPNNKYNPDPKATVRWGRQSWEEMMIGYFEVAVPASIQARDLLEPWSLRRWLTRR